MVKLFGKSETFIDIYDNTLSQKECDIIISQFEKSSALAEGMVSYNGITGLDHSHKKCIEIPGQKFSNRDIISNILNPYLQKCIFKYKKKYSALYWGSPWSLVDCYNVQKYETEDDGFKKWHCEHAPGLECSERILAWMFYLNDAKSGTDFVYYPNIKAKRGRCVIWPAGWTHCHKGTPNKGLKYIATGWVSYDNSQSK